MLSWGKDGKRLLPEGAVRPVGFGEDEEVLPYPTTSFPGFRLLSEYFCFPEKFLFLDIVGLGAIPLGPRDAGFEMEIRFRGAVPDTFHPTAENFRLHTTPIVNAFPRDGEPIAVTQLKVKHRVLGDYTHPEAYEVLCGRRRRVAPPSDGARFHRPPFFSFDHDSSAAGADGVYYHVTHRKSPAGAWLTYLSLISSAKGQAAGRGGAVAQRSPAPTAGSAGRWGSATSAATAARSSTSPPSATSPGPPSRSIRGSAPAPSGGSSRRWRSTSTRSPIPAAFRALLALYDAGEQPANRRRIESVREARLTPRETLDRGAPIRGTALALTVDETHFDDFGDLLLFSEVLSEFLSLYSGVNSFTELTVIQTPSGAILRCPATRGKQTSI